MMMMMMTYLFYYVLSVCNMIWYGYDMDMDAINIRENGPIFNNNTRFTQRPSRVLKLKNFSIEGFVPNPSSKILFVYVPDLVLWVISNK